MSTYNNNLPRVNVGATAGRRLSSLYDNVVEPTPTVREKNKMGFFRRKFMEWSKRAWEDNKSDIYKSTGVVRADGYVDSEPQLNFKIYGAVGGHVMEFRRYDNKNDRSNNQLYVISNDDDMGERVARIVNMEMLK
jgi:hypothetical protein